MTSQDDVIQRRWISVEEAGRILGVGKTQAYYLARQGVIPTFRISERRLLVPAKALEELEDAVIAQARAIAAQRVGAQAAAELGTLSPIQLTPRRAARRVKS